MDKKIQEALDGMKKTFEDFKTKNDEEIKLIKEDKGVSEVKETLEKMNSAIDEHQEKLEKMQTSMNRLSTHDGGEKGDEKTAKAASEVMTKWMRKGDRSITPDDEKILEEHFGPEYKSLTVQSDPEGGYLVRPEVANDMIKKIFESSPMRELSDGITISTDAWESPYDFDEPDVGWVGETQSRSDTDEANLKMIRIPVHELYAQPKATQKLLDDSAVNVEQWHAMKVAEKFAREENYQFINGDGILKPKGILQYAAGTGFNQLEQVNTGHATLITADGLIDLQTSLFEEFQSNATFLMRRATAGAIRKLKDNDDRYLWSVGGNLNGAPMNMLLGKPVRFAADLPAVAAGSLSVAYGDFRQGYKVVDRIGIRILRDPYTQKPFIKFYTTKRVGGGVQQFQAIKLQKTSA